MKQLLKKSTSILLAFVLMIMLCLPAFAVEASDVGAQTEVMGIGGGGAFLLSLINPTDSTNYIATCDMGSLYRSNDRGASWDRTETRCAIRAACFAPDGTLFTGDYGLYASHDRGETLELIYPQNVVHSVSRMGTREQLFAAQGYSNGLVCCITVYNQQVYFATQDWSYQLKVLRCNFDGSGLTELYSQQKYLEPTRARYGIVADASGVFFSDGQALYRINPTTRTAQTLYTGAGALNSFTKIGSEYYVLEELGDRTRILYTSDFSTYRDLNDRNTLPNSFTWDETHYFQWRFKKIVGNNSNHIYLIFESDCPGLDYKLYGILTYNGTNFEWVYDTVYKHRGALSLDHPLGWTYHLYGDIFDINTDPNDDHRIIMANLETVYELVYRGAQDYDVRTLHCDESADGVFYTTSGLDVQDTHTVRQDPFDPQHIIIATTDMGMQLSYDGGSTWRLHERNSRAVLNNCYDIYFDRDTQGLVYGIWCSRNGGAKNPTTDMLASYNQGGFAVSYDGGIHWDTAYSTGLPANSVPVGMRVVDNGDNLTIAVATCNNGFYLSHDSGRTFTSISGQMTTSNGGIWGQDVEIVGDTVYCLTAFDRINGITASKLYAYNMTTGATTQVNLGDVVIGRSLTYDETQGLFLSAVSYYRYQWMPGDIDTSVNYGGGVYKIENNAASLVYSEPDGIYNCAFTPDGTMYAAGVYGKLYVAQDGQLALYRGDLFEALKTITFSNDYTQLYIATDGGGTYRIDTLYQPEETGEPDVPDEPDEPDIPDIPDEPEQPGHTHREVVRNDSAASCTATGYTGDTYCADCGELLRTGTEIPMLPHTDVHCNARAATCTTPGYTGDMVCTICGAYTHIGMSIPALPHTEVIRNAVAATATNPGYTGDTFCAVCGELLSYGAVIPQLDHTEVIRDARPATCTSTGYTGDTYCADCGELLQHGAAIPMLPHTEVIRNAVAATGTTPGYTGDTYCADCGALLSYGTTIPTLSHTEVIRGAWAATCGYTGYTGDVYCADCGELLRYGSTIPTLPHTEVIRNARAATCTEMGYTGDVRCSECGEVLRTGASIPTTPHNEVVWSIRPATCTSPGYTGDTYCTDCGNLVRHGTSIPKVPHTAVLRNARAATCSSVGYSGDMVCTVCGEYTQNGVSIPTLPHTEQCVSNGDQTHNAVCTVCGHIGIYYAACTDENHDGVCDLCAGTLPQRTFAPETFRVSLSKTSTTRNRPVTMTVKASEDVVRVNIHGVMVQNYRTITETYTTDSGRNKVTVTVKYHVFTYTRNESNRGTFCYDVLALNSIGQHSEAKTAVLQVK